MYECGEEIVDCELSDADLSLLKNRFPKEKGEFGAECLVLKNRLPKKRLNS